MKTNRDIVSKPSALGQTAVAASDVILGLANINTLAERTVRLGAGDVLYCDPNSLMYTGLEVRSVVDAANSPGSLVTANAVGMYVAGKVMSIQHSGTGIYYFTRPDVRYIVRQYYTTANYIQFFFRFNPC